VIWNLVIRGVTTLKELENWTIDDVMKANTALLFLDQCKALPFEEK